MTALKKDNTYFDEILTASKEANTPTVNDHFDEILTAPKEDSTLRAKIYFDEILTASKEVNIPTVNNHFDEILTKSKDNSYVIIDNRDKLSKMNNQKLFFIHLLAGSLAFMLIIYTIYLCIKMCSKIPMEKGVVAQNFIKNITLGRKCRKDEMYDNLI